MPIVIEQMTNKKMNADEKIVQLNIELPEQKKRELKAHAAMLGKSIKDFALDAIFEKLQESTKKGTKRPFNYGPLANAA